jgi:hypothetical protein
VSAELAARRTAAAAVLADCRSDLDACDPDDGAFFAYWVGRLQMALELLLEATGAEVSGQNADRTDTSAPSGRTGG